MLRLTHQPKLFDSLEDELLVHLRHIEYPDDFDWSDWWEELPHHIRNLYVGAGYFSSAWTIPGDPFNILKVSHRESDACRHYMEWAATHPHRHAPKIHSIRHMENLMFVRMERYYPLPNRHKMLRENVPGYKVLMGEKRPSHRLGHEQLCAQIRREFVNHHFDLHANNVMMDREGAYIITDPVSYSEYDESW